MDEILKMLNRYCDLTLPANQLGMPDYLWSQLRILHYVVDKLEIMIKHTEAKLREWEDI
jgi:hypothetical protein